MKLDLFDEKLVGRVSLPKNKTKSLYNLPSMFGKISNFQVKCKFKAGMLEMCNAESSNEKQNIAVFFFEGRSFPMSCFFFVKIIKSLLPFPFFVFFFVPKKQKECKRSFLGKKQQKKRYFFPESKENAQVLLLFCFFEARSFPMSFFVLSKLTKVCCFFLFFVQKKAKKMHELSPPPHFLFFSCAKNLLLFFCCFFKNKIKMFLFYSSVFLCVSFVFTE